MRIDLKHFKLLKGQRQYYFVIALGVILVIVIFLIVIISFQGNTANTLPPTTPTSTPIPSYSPTVTHTNPDLHNLNIKAASNLVTREEARTPLSQSDMQSKAHILQLLPQGQNYGTVYASKNINIYYVQSLDLFDVDILTIDVASAKQEAENWFKQQGMSQQGICDLPLGFYLSGDSANILDNGNFIFNPLPDGC